jgi:hypothetical protein
VFVIGLVCAALKVDRGVYRHSGFLLTIELIQLRALASGSF